ncbi:hypothetical protein FKM82_011806 [Ascaphus truei]
MMCVHCKELLCTAILLLCSVPLACGFVVKGVEGRSVTLPCTYKVTNANDITTMCWGRDSCPNSKCNQPLIWTDGLQVTWRESQRYQLNVDISTGDVSLTILNPSLQDQGAYCCRIEHQGWFNDMKLNMQLKLDRAPTTTRPNTVRTSPAKTLPPSARSTTSVSHTQPLPTTLDARMEADPVDPLSTASTTTRSNIVTTSLGKTLPLSARSSTSVSDTQPLPTTPDARIETEPGDPLSTAPTTARLNIVRKSTSSDTQPLPTTLDARNETDPVDSLSTEFTPHHPSWLPQVTSSSADLPVTETERESDITTHAWLDMNYSLTLTDQEEVFNNNGGISDHLLDENTPLQKREKADGIPVYILLTVISASLIVVALVCLLVLKLRGKGGGAYHFHTDPGLELVTHEEKLKDEI